MARRIPHRLSPRLAGKTEWLPTPRQRPVRFRLELTGGHIRDPEKPGAVPPAVPAKWANLVFRRRRDAAG